MAQIGEGELKSSCAILTGYLSGNCDDDCERCLLCYHDLRLPFYPTCIQSFAQEQTCHSLFEKDLGHWS